MLLFEVQLVINKISSNWSMTRDRHAKKEIFSSSVGVSSAAWQVVFTFCAASVHWKWTWNLWLLYETDLRTVIFLHLRPQVLFGAEHADRPLRFLVNSPLKSRLMEFATGTLRLCFGLFAIILLLYLAAKIPSCGGRQVFEGPWGCWLGPLTSCS